MHFGKRGYTRVPRADARSTIARSAIIIRKQIFFGTNMYEITQDRYGWFSVAIFNNVNICTGNKKHVQEKKIFIQQIKFTIQKIIILCSTLRIRIPEFEISIQE